MCLDHEGREIPNSKHTTNFFLSVKQENCGVRH